MHRNFSHLPTHEEFVDIVRAFFDDSPRKSQILLYKYICSLFDLPNEWKSGYRGYNYYRADIYAYSKHFSAKTWADLADIHVDLLDSAYFFSPLYSKKDDFLVDMYMRSEELLRIGCMWVLNHKPFTTWPSGYPRKQQLVFARLVKKYNNLASAMLLRV